MLGFSLGTLAVSITIAAFVRRDSTLSVMGGGFWFVFGVYCRGLSVITWDIYYALFFLAIFCGIVTAWGGLGENIRAKRRLNKQKKQELKVRVVTDIEGRPVRDPEQRRLIERLRTDQVTHTAHMQKRRETKQDLKDKGW